MLRFVTRFGRSKIEKFRSLESSLLCPQSLITTPQLDVSESTKRDSRPINETTGMGGCILMASSASSPLCSYFHTTSKRLADEKETPPLEKYEDECWTDYGSGGETDEEDRCLVEAFTSIQELEMKEEQISLEIAKLQKEKARVQEMQTCIWLRYLFQRYRMAAREVLDPLLTVDIEELKDPYSLNTKMYSYHYPLFLKKLQKNIESNQNFQSMLRCIGIHELGDFFEITSFALEHDHETWKKYSLFPDLYYLEDETRLKVTFSAPFDVDGSEHFIQKLDCKSTQEKCRKMVSYLSKLNSWAYED